MRVRRLGEAVTLGPLVAECRFHMLESALKDIIGRMSNHDLAREISDPEVHDAGVAYHIHLAKATDSDAKREMHQARAKAHSSAASIIRAQKKHGRGGDTSMEVSTSNARATNR
jgi:hypothetical protein